MSFHLSAQDIRVDDGHILRARLDNGEGEMVDAEFDLDTVLGNDDGIFSWGGENFSHSAQGITFAMEGDGVPILRAGLTNLNGDVNWHDVNLAERLTNAGGKFQLE
ncbi:Cyanovirin-N [Apiosordaria backusii]|uniref:Cyanovirin-N n=1 Tax=Apiosordaria backusii TaxID=314023 RepID=A0AA39ZY27_9PEZI|nr:Cyanovirin-N [Apiosordaria backusii]